MKRILSLVLIALLLLCHPPVRAAQQVVVCVLDSGSNLPEAQGWNALDDSGDLTDSAGHGTRIHTLLLQGAPDADIYMLKCFEPGSAFQEEAVIRALYAAVDEYQADVISMNWTVNQERPALYEAIRYAHDSGAALVAPAGNLSLSNRLGATVYPAAWEEVIGVGGVDLDETGEPAASLLYLSGEAVFLCARADWGGERGSSYASCRVAAAIAAYLCQSPEAGAQDLREMLREAARDVGEPGYDTVYGWGYLDSE